MNGYFREKPIAQKHTYIQRHTHKNTSTHIVRKKNTDYCCVTYVCWKARCRRSGRECCVYWASSQTSTCHWHRGTLAPPDGEVGYSTSVSTTATRYRAPSHRTPDGWTLVERTSWTAFVCDTTARTCRRSRRHSPSDRRPSSYTHTHTHSGASERNWVHGPEYCLTPLRGFNVTNSSRNLLVVPRHRLSSYGRRAFSVAGLVIWNWLPDSLRDPAISRDSFKRSLKTFLFSAYSCT